MIIYRIFNKIDEKSYIGQSINNFNKRYKGGDWSKYNHNPILKNAVSKYGLENFEFEILEDNISDIDELNKLEIKYANDYNSYRPNGYNIRGCGENKFVDDSLKEHLSTFRIGTNYKPNNKKSSVYKGVYWREGKKSWMCRFDNNLIKKVKYTSSEIEAAEMYDKVCLYLMGRESFINFEENREDYLNSDLEYFYNNFFLKTKKKKKEGYIKDDTDLINKISPLIWKMSIPKMAKELGVTVRKINYCIKKNKLKSPGKNYWQTH
jgi:group I intron endonuclease